MIREKTNVDISFCLPVYNVKNYIEECIESIYEQGIEYFEIICVDDSSTDGSQEELERLANIHDEMIVIHNDSNKGVSYSRNIAAKAARGGYIWFVDPDDKLIPGAAKMYLDVAYETKADAVFGKYICAKESFEGLQIYKGTDKYQVVDFTNTDSFYSTDQKGNICVAIWVGIFNKSFLSDNRIQFREGLNYLEDVLFYVEFGIRAKRVVSIDHYGYCYRIRKASIAHDYNHYFRQVEASKTVLLILKQLNSDHSKYSHSILVNMTRLEMSNEIVLVRMLDHAYIRDALNTFKDGGFYPHRMDLHANMVTVRGKYKILYRALRIEPVFWLIHYTYILFRKAGLRLK